jgi:hypothetical protein
MQNRERDMRERNAADPQATAGKLLKRSGEGILFNDQRVRQGSHQGRAMVTRDQKIILGEMRQMGVRGLLVFARTTGAPISQRSAGTAGRTMAHLSDLEPRFVSQWCGEGRAVFSERQNSPLF